MARGFQRVAVTVMAGIQRTQAEGLAAHEERMRRVETNLAGISGKLNGLIRHIPSSPRQEPPGPPVQPGQDASPCNISARFAVFTGT